MISIADYLRVKAFAFGAKSPEDILARAMIKILTDKARAQNLDPREVLERMNSRLRMAEDRTAAEDPNDDPMDLWNQIRPTVNSMRLHNMADKGKTQITLGTTDKRKKGKQLYRVLLHREKTKITPIEISYINREKDSFQDMIWSQQGIVAEIWGDYKAPPTGAPAAP